MSRDRSLSVTLRGNVTPYVAAIRQAHTATRDFATRFIGVKDWPGCREIGECAMGVGGMDFIRV